MEKSKKGLLEHYKCKEPNLFIQYDGFDLQDGGDDVMRPDNEGHCVMSRLTYELMHGSSVRVLINPETSKEDVLVLLDKIKECIKNDGNWQVEVKKELDSFNESEELRNKLKESISNDNYTS